MYGDQLEMWIFGHSRWRSFHPGPSDILGAALSEAKPSQDQVSPDSTHCAQEVVNNACPVPSAADTPPAPWTASPPVPSSTPLQRPFPQDSVSTSTLEASGSLARITALSPAGFGVQKIPCGSRESVMGYARSATGSFPPGIVAGARLAGLPASSHSLAQFPVGLSQRTCPPLEQVLGARIRLRSSIPLGGTLPLRGSSPTGTPAHGLTFSFFRPWSSLRRRVVAQVGPGAPPTKPDVVARIG